MSHRQPQSHCSTLASAQRVWGVMRAHRIPVSLAVVSLLTLIGPTDSALADELDLRGSERALVGQTVTVTEAGVRFKTLQDQAVLYSWDQVRDLRSESSSRQEAFDARRVFADELWRARSRIERQDYPKAEPILERLFADMIGQTHETALVVSEGLLRARLARQAQTTAVIPWLETLRQYHAGVTRKAYLGMKPVIDERTGLCTALPPVWITGPGVQTMVSDLAGYAPAEAPRIDRLAQLYAAAARQAVGQPPAELPGRGGRSRLQDRQAEGPPDALNIGIAIVSAMIEASTADGNSAAISRVSGVLSRYADNHNSLAVWARYGLGIARLSVADPRTRRRGLVDLLYIPSELADLDPYMSGMAIYAAIEHLEPMGLDEAVKSLRHELETRYADHPIHRRTQPDRRAAAPSMELDS